MTCLSQWNVKWCVLLLGKSIKVLVSNSLSSLFLLQKPTTFQMVNPEHRREASEEQRPHQHTMAVYHEWEINLRCFKPFIFGSCVLLQQNPAYFDYYALYSDYVNSFTYCYEDFLKVLSKLGSSMCLMQLHSNYMLPSFLPNRICSNLAN